MAKPQKGLRVVVKLLGFGIGGLIGFGLGFPIFNLAVYPFVKPDQGGGLMIVNVGGIFELFLVLIISTLAGAFVGLWFVSNRLN